MQKVLIVDDSESDQFIAKFTIEEFDENIEVLQTYNGQEALELLDQMNEQPDVIFLDINMPIMDGHEFLQAYSKRDVQTAIIVMLTSSYQKQDIERSKAYKCVKQYVDKPLDHKDLENVKKMLFATDADKSNEL